MTGSGRALTRYDEARTRAHSPSMSHLRLHPVASLDLYVGLMRDMAELAKLKTTEQGDREAIRAHYDLQRMAMEGELRQVELAIENDRDAFDALRKDNKDLVNRLMDMGEIDAAILMQTRFLDRFGGSTLDKLIGRRRNGNW